MDKKKTILIWFSAGASSAIAAKYAVKKYGNFCRIVYCDTGGEHPDNMRFLKDVELWLGYPIEILKNEKYKDHFDVFKKTQYLVGPYGARCTVELKKRIRFQIQSPEDIHVFGYTAEEKKRAKIFEMANPELKTWWPLIEENITKEDCLGILWKSKIDIPVMYKMGYGHNNCIGCVKGGMGYWNKIRVDFPEHFKKMAQIERELKRTIIRLKSGGKIYLDELNQSAGNFATEPAINCGLGCQIATDDLST